MCSFALKHSPVSFLSLLQKANVWRRKLHKHIIFVAPLSSPNFPRTGSHYTVAEMCQVPALIWRGVIGRSKCNTFMFCITMTVQRWPLQNCSYLRAEGNCGDMFKRVGKSYLYCSNPAVIMHSPTICQLFIKYF